MTLICDVPRDDSSRSTSAPGRNKYGAQRFISQKSSYFSD